MKLPTDTRLDVQVIFLSICNKVFDFEEIRIYTGDCENFEKVHKISKDNEQLCRFSFRRRIANEILFWQVIYIGTQNMKTTVVSENRSEKIFT